MAAAGVRTTKGLYFTFTLLCLVCLASSLIGKDQLEKLKEEVVQRAQQEIDKVKAQHESEMTISLDVANEYVNFMEQMKALMNKIHLHGDFPPAKAFLESTKRVIEKFETYIEMNRGELGANIEEIDEKVRKTKKLVEFLEEMQAEL